MTKLWMGLVAHVSVPGTVPVFLHQEEEPTDDRYIAELVDRKVPASELEVVGSFDIAHAMKTHFGSKWAILNFVRENF